MRELAAVDVLIVVLYIIGTTLLGAWFSRRQRDLQTYFVGDRNVSWWLVLISIVATETSTVTFLSVPGLAFSADGGNLTFLQLAFGYVIGRIVIAIFLLPQYLRGELFTAYQLLRQRFSPAVQRAASGIFLLTRTVADGLRLYLTALLLQQFTGWSIQLSILVMGVTTILYTYLGGMQAVIWTDLIQFVIYILGAILAGAILLQQLGGLDVFTAIGMAHDKFNVVNFAGDPNQPYLSQPFTFWAGLIGGAFITMATHGADQLMVQRYLCSRSLGQARTALVLSGFVVLVQFLLFLLIGVGLFVLYRPDLMPKELRPLNDEVFGRFIVGSLPVGLVGLVIAAVLAAAMSTLSSSLNSSASAFVTDFYRPLRPGRREQHYLLLSKIMTMFWGVAQMAVALIALYIQGQRSVINQVLSVAALTTGLILGLFLLGQMRRPVTSRAALFGLVGGLLTVLFVWIPSELGEPLRSAGEADWWFSQLFLSWSRIKLAWPWYAPVGTLSTILFALLGNLLLGRGHGSSANGGPQPGLVQSR